MNNSSTVNPPIIIDEPEPEPEDTKPIIVSQPDPRLWNGMTPGQALADF